MSAFLESSLTQLVFQLISVCVHYAASGQERKHPFLFHFSRYSLKTCVVVGLGIRSKQQCALLHSPLAEQRSKWSTYQSYINHKSVSHISDEAIHMDPKVAERQEQSTALATGTTVNA